MPTGTRAQLGNVIFDDILYMPAVTFPTLAAGASSANTLTIAGVLIGDLLSWNIVIPPLHLQIDNMYVSAPNVVTILWGTDATGISTATCNLLVEVMRPENGSLGLTALPNNVS